MKPRYSCSSCESDLQWGDASCGNRGKPVEWPGSAKAQREVRKERKPSDKPGTASGLVSWKMMVGVAVFIVGGVVLMEVLTGPKNVPSAPSQPVQGASAANMEAMKHLTELEQQVEANPNDLESLLHLANFAHDNRFYDKAIVHYKKYIEKDPKNADAIVDLGICYNDIGDFDQAQATMERALKVKPDHLLGHFNLGIVNLKSGDLEKSNEWFKKTVALSPNSEVGKRAQQLINQHLNIPPN